MFGNRLGGECQLLPVNACKYKSSAVADKPLKKRKIENTRINENPLSASFSDDLDHPQYRNIDRCDRKASGVAL